MTSSFHQANPDDYRTKMLVVNSNLQLTGSCVIVLTLGVGTGARLVL